MPTQASIDRVKQALARKADGVAHVLKTPEGSKMMDVLEKEFLFGRLLGDSPEKTAFALGAREVVLYLRTLRDFNERMTTGTGD